MAYTPRSDSRALKLRGGAITALPKALLPLGAFSMVQNLRPEHPGFSKRPGCSKLHTTADSTNQVLTLYQFNKNRVSDTHFFAQMGDADVLEATNEPPASTTGVFGSEVFSGSSGQVPASWSTIEDMMLYSNGVDQHQIYAGDGSYVTGFIVYKGAAAIPDVPELGEDYSLEVSDGDSTTVAILDSLNTLANYDAVYINTPVPVSAFDITVSAANGNSATATLAYWNGAWTSVSGQSDGTASGGATLAQTGTLSFTEPTDIKTKFMFGINGFWYRLVVSAALDAEVEISGVTFQSSWQNIINVWDGTLQEAIEVQVEGTSTFAVYSATAVDVDALASGKKIVISCTDPIEGLYFDVGSTPNATGTAVTAIKYWDGDSFESVGTVNDGTSGLSNSGFMTFPRQATVQPLQFESSQYSAYWYELTLDTQLSADMVISIYYMPYFNITELGKSVCNVAWKDRAVYSFDQYGNYIYVSAQSQPLILNGADYAILKAGDGRSNKVVAMRRFHNDLMVWQEEKGVEGGCLTIFEGYSPTTFGKLIVSSKIGTMNAKSVEVIDGVLTSTATDETIRTLAFFLSRYGVCVSDGRTVSIISDDIQNYFDPQESECIRRGYESEMWLKYDSAFNVIRIGLVSGSSATKPNVFPVFDLTDKVWYFDELAQELSTMEEVEAQSGNVTIVQVGGGTDDGQVYLLNSGSNDVSTAIDSYLTVELSSDGFFLELYELLLRCKVQSSGTISLAITANDIATNSISDISQTAETAGHHVRRHRFNVNVNDQHISLKIQNDNAGESMYLYDLGLGLDEWIGR